jgi:hypothetical protein
MPETWVFYDYAARYLLAKYKIRSLRLVTGYQSASDPSNFLRAQMEVLLFDELGIEEGSALNSL